MTIDLDELERSLELAEMGQEADGNANACMASLPALIRIARAAKALDKKGWFTSDMGNASPCASELAALSEALREVK